jgi:hypothetical protein
MDKYIFKLIIKRFGFIFILDFLLFSFLITTIVNNYKFFSLILTCTLITLLTYYSINYLIYLSNLNQQQKDLNNNYQFKINKKLANFLFRNEYVYKFVKLLVKRKFFKSELNILLASDNNNSTDFLLDDSSSSINNSIIDTNQLENDLKNKTDKFFKKFSINFLELWYLPYVSNDSDFLKDAQMQLHCLFNDFFMRLNNTHKLTLFSNFIYLFNENFINMAINFKINNEKLPLDQLHPALRNSPTSEIIYNKKIVQIILRKSAPNFNINHPLIEELFMQIIGKNCIETLINLMTKPNFLYYAISLMISKRKTNEAFNNQIEKHSQSEKTIEEQQNDSLMNDSMTNSATHIDLAENENSEQNKIGSDRIITSSPALSDHLTTVSNNQHQTYLQIYNLIIPYTETGHEVGSGKEYTIYNIEVI